MSEQNNTNIQKPAKIWCDPVSIKTRETQYGNILKMGIKVDPMIEFLNKYKNERGFVNLDINERKELGQFGQSHSVALDTWSPNTNQPSPASKVITSKKTATKKTEPAPEKSESTEQPPDNNDF